MCCIEGITHQHILQGFTIRLDLDGEAPYDVVELVEGVFECGELQHKQFIPCLSHRGSFRGECDGMRFLYGFATRSGFGEFLRQHSTKAIHAAISGNDKWGAIEAWCFQHGFGC